MQKLRSSPQRALLLTTAMFSGAHADAIFAAASTLCERVEQPEDDRPRLEWEGLAERFEEIKAKADDAGRVHFTPLAYNQAVLTYFWTNRPDLRDDFRCWVETTLGHQRLSSADRDEVVTRFAKQALRTDRPDDLLLLVEHWVTRTDIRRPSDLLPQAAKAVVCGLEDERHSRSFRKHLYTWSLDDGLSADLAQVGRPGVLGSARVELSPAGLGPAAPHPPAPLRCSRRHGTRRPAGPHQPRPWPIPLSARPSNRRPDEGGVRRCRPGCSWTWPPPTASSGSGPRRSSLTRSILIRAPCVPVHPATRGEPRAMTVRVPLTVHPYQQRGGDEGT